MSLGLVLLLPLVAGADEATPMNVLVEFENAPLKKDYANVCPLWQAQSSDAKSKMLEIAQAIVLKSLAKFKSPEEERAVVSTCLSQGVQPARVKIDDACKTSDSESAVRLFNDWRWACIPARYRE